MIFDGYRVLFITFIAVLFICTLISIFYKGKYKLTQIFTIIIVSLVCLLISGYYLGEIGVIADEKGIGGDSASSMMFLMIAFLSFLNPFIITLKQK